MKRRLSRKARNEKEKRLFTWSKNEKEKKHFSGSKNEKEERHFSESIKKHKKESCLLGKSRRTKGTGLHKACGDLRIKKFPIAKCNRKSWRRRRGSNSCAGYPT